jgi:hypothetical protein
MALLDNAYPKLESISRTSSKISIASNFLSLSITKELYQP